MARGLQKAQYNADDGKVYTTRVKKNTVAMASAGWTAGSGADGALPKRFKLRHVIGVDSSGFRRSLSIGSLTATLWTGAATTFDLDDDDGGTSTYTVTGRAGERATF